MRSIPQAMTWEMLTHGRWSLIAAALGANALPTLLLTALRIEGAVDPQDPSQFVMHLVLVQINMFVFATGVFAAQGSPSRLYAMPLPTTTLVAWQMLPAMALVALELVVTTAALNAVFDLGWPLWGPALFVAVAMAAVQATLWFTEKSAWLPWVLMLVALVLGLWFKSRHGAMFSLPTRLWTEVTPAEVLTLVMFFLLSYYVAVVGVARNRRGDALPPLGIMAWLERQLDAAPEVGRPFGTPAQAQFWFEWRQKGWAMPAMAVFGLFMGFLCWLIFSRNTQDLFEGLIVGGGLLSLMAFIGALIVGNSGPNDANYEMGHFLAARPMTNADLARTILNVAAKSVLVAWIIWGVAFLVVYLILLAIQAVPESALSKKLEWWYFPATLLGPWIVVMSFALGGLTGRLRLFVGLFCGLIAMFIGLSLVSKYALSYEAREQFSQGVVFTSGLVFVLGTAWAFVAARRQSLLGSQAIYVALSVWAVLCMLVAVEWILHPAKPLPVCVFAIGLSALVVAPFATTPLALAWNRNR